MVVQWVAAGFDPDAFGRQTPRSLGLALKGADLARRRRLADAALAARAASHTDAAGFRQFQRDLESSTGRQSLPPEAMAAALSSMANKLGAISMDDYRRRIRGQK